MSINCDSYQTLSFPSELLCNEENICELLESLDISKSNGPDGISARMLKYTAASIAPSITCLFNQSLQSCRIPSEWKSSLVVPVPKGSNSHSPTNYRPISLLVVLSKILEKHVHSIIIQNLNLYRPISNSQWGFTAASGRYFCPAFHYAWLVSVIRRGQRHMRHFPGLQESLRLGSSQDIDW